MTSMHVELHLPADPEATERLGAWIGARLGPGAVLALVGDLGTGKTTLVRGLARGLALDDPDQVQSPTYLLVVEHQGPIPLRHADAYLPAKLAGFLDDGGLEYLFAADAVVVIEWADRVADHLPKHTLWLELAVAADGGRQVRWRADRAGDFPFLADLPKMT
jgi:tRNA threonylcarbamoyladenosine biosynthesis protein TsaE